MKRRLCFHYKKINKYVKKKEGEESDEGIAYLRISRMNAQELLQGLSC